MYMNEEQEKNYNQWSVEKGDYVRDDEATKTYQRRRNIMKKLKTIVWIFGYLIIISVASYFLFALI